LNVVYLQDKVRFELPTDSKDAFRCLQNAGLNSAIDQLGVSVRYL